MSDNNVLVLPDRPLVTVDRGELGAAIITVTGMSDCLQRVETESVIVPAECLAAVIEALREIDG